MNSSPINRRELVSRHDITLDRADERARLQVGNGAFAVGLDCTGLQTFYGNTLSDWGWHTAPPAPNVQPDNFRLAPFDAKDKFPAQYNKLQELLHGRPPEELYDMKTDPGQLNNLADDPKQKAKLQELAKAVADWRKKTGDYQTHPREITRRTAPEATF